MTQDQTAMDKLKVDGEWDFAVRCDNDEQFQTVWKWCLTRAVSHYSSDYLDYQVDCPLVGISDGRIYIYAPSAPFKTMISYEQWDQIVNPNNDAAEGQKFDLGKPRMSLMPPIALSRTLEVLEYGAAKYSADNWRKVDQAQTRYFDAAHRHLAAWRQGEQTDSESGLSHLAHAACCLNFLLELEQGTQGAPEKWQWN